MSLAAVLSATAVPARPGLHPYVQPDGTVIMVRQSGDEYSHTVTDRYGRLLADDGNGRLVPAESITAVRDDNAPNPRLKRSRQARHMAAAQEYPWFGEPDFNPGICPTSFPACGERRGLVILVEYQDVRFNTPDAKDYFTRMLNEEGFSDYGATGSARDYFVYNSMGAFTPQFDVYGPVLLPDKRLHYGVNDSWGNDKRPHEMVIEACQLLDAEIDFNDYDIDGDGFVDNIFVIYADKGENAGGPATSVWPHSADIFDMTGRYHEFDGIKINHYACTNETVEYNGQNRPDGIGTFVHEFGHVIGLPDLYTTVYNKAFTPGEWSVMDEGPYNNEGRTPPNYSAYERFSLGWIEPERLSAGDKELLPIDVSNHCYIVTSDRPNEYFLLENRRQEGNDFYIPWHGMLIWHVDYDADIWFANEVNNEVGHQRVDLVEADGILSDGTTAGDSFPGVFGVTSFGAMTSPSFTCWSGAPAGYELTSIREEGDVVRFNVAGGSGIGGDADGTKPWRLEGDILTAGDDVRIVDMMGRIVSSLRSGESLGLVRGAVYVVVSDNVSDKICVR